MDPHKCPCCDGFGTRMRYNTYLPNSTSATPPMGEVTCVACKGSGVLWSPPPISPVSPAEFDAAPVPDIDLGTCTSDWTWDPVEGAYRLPDGTLIRLSYTESIGMT